MSGAWLVAACPAKLQAQQLMPRVQSGGSVPAGCAQSNRQRVDGLSTADRAPHLSPLPLVIVHVLNANHAPRHARAAQVVNREHRAALVLVGQEGKAARLACRGRHAG